MDSHKVVSKFSKLLTSKKFKIVKMRSDGNETTKSFVRFSHPHLDALSFGGVTPYLTLVYTTAEGSRSKLVPELKVNGYDTIIHAYYIKYFEGLRLDIMLDKEVLSETIPTFMDKVSKLMETIAILSATKATKELKNSLLYNCVKARYNKNMTTRHQFVYDEFDYKKYDRIPEGFEVQDNIWNYYVRLMINLYDDKIQILDPLPRVMRNTTKRSEDFKPVVYDDSYSLKIYWNQYNAQFQPILDVIEQKKVGVEKLFQF